MKKYEYSVHCNDAGAKFAILCATRSEARNEKKSLKEAGISSKIIQTVYQQVSCQEVR